jgi:hypothetical protein
LELPRDTALYIEWIDMDIETPKKDKCQGDYLRIKVSNFTKFYCGQLDGPKLLKLGPFDGTFTRKVKISFRSDNDGERGRGVKLYFYTNIQSSMFIMYLIDCNIILYSFLVLIVFVKFIAFSALVLVTSGRTLIGSLIAESSSEVIDMLNPSKKCNASSLPR